MSESKVDSATIYHRASFSNTSLIIKYIAAEGRRSLMAKGASRPNSPYAGQIDLFYKVDLIFLPSRSSDLHTLKEISLIDPHLGLRRSYANLVTAHYFALLVETITEPDTPIPEEHALLDKALLYLCDHESSWRVVQRFEQRILTLAGIGSPTTDLSEAFPGLHLRVPQQRKELRKLLVPGDRKS